MPTNQTIEAAQKLTDDIKNRREKIEKISLTLTEEEMKYIREAVVVDIQKILAQFKDEFTASPKTNLDGKPLDFIINLVGSTPVVATSESVPKWPQDLKIKNPPLSTPYYQIQYTYFIDILNELITDYQSGFYDDKLSFPVFQMILVRVDYLYKNNINSLKTLSKK